MFTKAAHLQAKIGLFNIVGNLAKKDYIAANFKKGKKISKKHIPYTLSQETEDAKKMYDLVFFSDYNELTIEQEEQIKGYLLRFRIFDNEYLQDIGGKAYFENSLKELQ